MLYASYRATLEIKGLGFDTMTKFIYFLELKIEGYRSLILDQRVIDCYSNNRYSELVLNGIITNQNGWKNYKKYIKQFSALAEQLHTTKDQIEVFIYTFGNNLKVNGK